MVASLSPVIQLAAAAAAAAATSLLATPIQAFVVGVGGVSRVGTWRTSITESTSPSALCFPSMTVDHQATTAVTATVMASTGAAANAAVPAGPSDYAPEMTLVRGRKVVHIATDRNRDATQAALTICDIIAAQAGVSRERADELVRFGAVYIGEDVRPNVSNGGSSDGDGDNGGSRRGGRGDRMNKQGGIAGMTDNQKRKMKAKKASGQLPFEGTSFDHMQLRRLGHDEGSNSPPAGSYLRVHCDPRTFSVAEGVTWMEQIVALTDDYVVVNKPAGMPTVPTIDNVVQSVMHQTQLAVARALGYNGDKLPLMHAVSRLDVCTSGVVVFALNKRSAGKLNELFSARQVTKHYLALLTPGPPIRSGSLAHCCRGKSFDGMRRAKIYADYDPDLLEGSKWGGHWQEARSTVMKCVPARGPAVDAAVAADRAAQRSQSTSKDVPETPLADEETEEDGYPAHLCLMRLETGRNHQLRMQLAAMGAGIVGDTQYRGIVGRLHRGVPEDDRTDIFGQEPEAIALTAARLEFEWESEHVVYTVRPPPWAITEQPLRSVVVESGAGRVGGEEGRNTVV